MITVEPNGKTIASNYKKGLLKTNSFINHPSFVHHKWSTVDLLFRSEYHGKELLELFGNYHGIITDSENRRWKIWVLNYNQQMILVMCNKSGGTSYEYVYDQHNEVNGIDLVEFTNELLNLICPISDRYSLYTQMATELGI